MVLDLLAWLVVQVLFFVTWAAVGGGLVWVLTTVRRTPREVLQLRVFQNIRELERGLGALAAGTFAGLITVAPLLVMIDPPLAWTFAWTVLWSLPTLYGGWRIVRLLRGREVGPL